MEYTALLVLPIINLTENGTYWEQGQPDYPNDADYCLQAYTNHNYMSNRTVQIAEHLKNRNPQHYWYQHYTILVKLLSVQQMENGYPSKLQQLVQEGKFLGEKQKFQLSNGLNVHQTQWSEVTFYQLERNPKGNVNITYYKVGRKW